MLFRAAVGGAGTGGSPGDAAVVSLPAGSGRAGGRRDEIAVEQGEPGHGRRLRPGPRGPGARAVGRFGQVVAEPLRAWIGPRRSCLGTGAADVERLSPVEVSGRYLAHIRAGMGRRFPASAGPAGFVLTLPASFDEIARELTVKAAARAGLARVVLIEEPQAAFYAWIYKHCPRLAAAGQPGPEDLGLRHRRRHVRLHADPRRAATERGERFPLPSACARRSSTSSSAATISIWPWPITSRIDSPTAASRAAAVVRLVRNCQRVKETLLGTMPPNVTVNVAGSGSRLIGGGLRLEVTRDEVRSVLLDGFFP